MFQRKKWGCLATLASYTARPCDRRLLVSFVPIRPSVRPNSTADSADHLRSEGQHQHVIRIADQKGNPDHAGGQWSGLRGIGDHLNLVCLDDANMTAMRSCQFALASAPIAPQTFHGSLGPNDGTGRLSADQVRAIFSVSRPCCRRSCAPPRKPRRHRQRRRCGQPQPVLVVHRHDEAELAREVEPVKAVGLAFEDHGFGSQTPSGRDRIGAAVRRIDHRHDDDRIGFFNLPASGRGVVEGTERALGLAINPQQKALFLRLGLAGSWRLLAAELLCQSASCKHGGSIRQAHYSSLRASRRRVRPLGGTSSAALGFELDLQCVGANCVAH
jgi:hypothetical protein